MRLSAHAEAALAGEPGVNAAFNLGLGFDQECAALIDGGTFTLDLDPLEMLLGVLPLLQLALHVWFAEHLPRLRGVSELESAATALSFITGGLFSPRAAFRPFLIIYATTISRGDDFNTDTVM